MSASGDETLSLESLFAFVDGLSPRADEPGAVSARDGALGAPEDPSSCEAVEGEAAGEVPKEPAASEGPAFALGAALGKDDVPADPASGEEASGDFCDLALLSMVVRLRPDLGAAAPEPAPCGGKPSEPAEAAPDPGLPPAPVPGGPFDVLASPSAASAGDSQAREPEADAAADAPLPSASAEPPERASAAVFPVAAATLAELFAAAAAPVERGGADAPEVLAGKAPTGLAGRAVDARPRHARGKHAADSGAGGSASAPVGREPSMPTGRPQPSEHGDAPASSDEADRPAEGILGEPGRRARRTGPSSVDEVRASIEERLVKLVCKNVQQISAPQASAPQAAPLAGRTAGGSAAPPPEQSGEGEAREAKSAPAEGGGPAMPSSPEDGSGAGAPAAALDDEQAPAPDPEIEAIGSGPSIIFDEPASSIEEGMRLAESEHRRGFAFKAAVGAAIGAAVIAMLALLAFNLPFFAGAPEGADGDGAAAPARQTASDEVLDTSGAKAGEPAMGSRERDLSGTVVYRYTASGPDGEARPTVETVSFGSDGLCGTSTIEVELSDAETAEAFLEGLERDFGSAYRNGSVEGSAVRATVDVSTNKLDREAYEDELRVSVDDLVIVKKA